MNKRSYFEIGLKLLSVYHLALFINAIPYAFFPFAVNAADNIRNEFLYYGLNFILPLTYLFTGIVLAKYSTKISSLFFIEDRQPGQDIANEPTRKFLTYGFILVGIFYLIGSISRLIAKGINMAATDMGVFYWSEILSQALMTVLSIILIVKSGFVIELIRTKSDSDI